MFAGHASFPIFAPLAPPKGVRYSSDPAKAPRLRASARKCRSGNSDPGSSGVGNAGGTLARGNAGIEQFPSAACGKRYTASDDSATRVSSAHDSCQRELCASRLVTQASGPRKSGSDFGMTASTRHAVRVANFWPNAQKVKRICSAGCVKSSMVALNSEISQLGGVLNNQPFVSSQSGLARSAGCGEQDLAFCNTHGVQNTIFFKSCRHRVLNTPAFQSLALS